MSSIHLLKAARKWHRKTAAVLFVCFFFISITGILLGWKNLFASKIYSAPQVNRKFTAGRIGEWIPMDSLLRIATADLHTLVPDAGNARAVSMNAVLDKEYVRFAFKNDYMVQLNARSGALMSIEKKATDLLIRIHDGEILDDIMHSGNAAGKTTYTSLMGFALFFLTLSGFWLRFGPTRARAKNQAP